jgi:hypothetical protein
MTFGPKMPGHCLACKQAVYEILEVRVEPGHPMDGWPLRMGRPLDHQTQIELLMSDGSEADILFCLACAKKVTAVDYMAIWQACIEANDLVLSVAGRSENERKMHRAKMMAIWPVTVGLLRRHDATTGLLIVDRR